jgi:hypothetical protein
MNQTGKNASITAAVVESEVELIQNHKKKLRAVLGKQTNTRMGKIRVLRKTLPTKALSSEGKKHKITILRCQISQCLSNPEILPLAKCSQKEMRASYLEVT